MVRVQRGGNIPSSPRLVPILQNVRSYEIIFAVDPGTDGTEDVILEHRARDPPIKLLVFSRRFGQPAATLAGIEHAVAATACVVMDVDLQDPPELIVEMLAKWREGYDVVYAQRRRAHGRDAGRSASSPWSATG